MELNICHLYPDVLNLYGDRGNIACMKKRLEWRGIGCAVTELPLGTVLCGHGNNGEDGTEGVRYKNVYGTYSHGPLLPKNPALCDEILRGALCRKYGAAELAPLDDSAEEAARQVMLTRLHIL